MVRAGMQLYTLRDIAEKDYEKALALTKELGFPGAQVSGTFGLSVDDIARLFRKHDLKVAGIHTGMEALVKDLDRAVGEAETLGTHDLVAPSVPREYRADAEGWVRAAKMMDELGARLRERGMFLSYHNHAFEFETVPGSDKCGFDILFETASAENLQPELDLYWLLYGGQDPAEYLRRFKAHVRLIHIKDGRCGEKPVFTELGAGEVKWDEAFAACDETTAEWLLYEQDRCEVSSEDSSRKSAEFLKASGRL